MVMTRFEGIRSMIHSPAPSGTMETQLSKACPKALPPHVRISTYRGSISVCIRGSEAITTYRGGIRRRLWEHDRGTLKEYERMQTFIKYTDLHRIRASTCGIDGTRNGIEERDGFKSSFIQDACLQRSISAALPNPGLKYLVVV
jgi:hypothetical protein